MAAASTARTARSESTIWACVDPAVTVQPGWKSTCTSTIGRATARTHAPREARRSDRTATDGDYSGRPDADAPPVAALGHRARSLRKRRARVSGGNCGRGATGPARVRALHACGVCRGPLPAPLRPGRRGGDDQVRLPLLG